MHYSWQGYALAPAVFADAARYWFCCGRHGKEARSRPDLSEWWPRIKEAA